MTKEYTSALFQFDPATDPKKTLARARRLLQDRQISSSDFAVIERRVLKKGSARGSDEDGQPDEVGERGPTIEAGDDVAGCIRNIIALAHSRDPKDEAEYKRLQPALLELYALKEQGVKKVPADFEHLKKVPVDFEHLLAEDDSTA